MDDDCGCMHSILEKAKTNCTYCGDLTWTVMKWGVPVHKRACPCSRKTGYYQGNADCYLPKGIGHHVWIEDNTCIRCGKCAKSKTTKPQ